MPSSSSSSFNFNSNAGLPDRRPSFTTTYQSQSSMAPRPPLPGQTQRPVSPIRWDSTSSGVTGTSSNVHATMSGSSGNYSHDQQVYSPETPNAWASTSPQRRMQQQQQPPAPGPVDLPSPVAVGASSSYSNGIPRHGQSMSGAMSPGQARSPVAERNDRAILAQTQPDGHAPRAQQQQQPATPRAPPFVRVRVVGIDRAKKELGVKMDAQTNIPTYHRQHASAFSRTYAEFSALHGALSANHPETILPALPLPQTSATSEDEEDRFLKGIFQRFIDRITRDRALVLDDELRSFVEADFGVGSLIECPGSRILTVPILQYSPLTRAKKLKSSAGGFLSRSSSRPTLMLDENGEPDFLQTSKVQSAALETQLLETCKTLEKALSASSASSSSFSEVGATWASFSTTEQYAPLAAGMRALSEAFNRTAALDNGQGNATALILGDALAYSAAEARAAKDALLQRQYGLDELHSSIKTSIAKRRQIEKLRTSGSIKPEKVSEALDELDEAMKSEQNLNNRVEAISTNLRPALQTHLRTMDEDLFSTLLHHARTMAAYENRKLAELQGLQERLVKMSEQPKANDGSIIYHRNNQQQAQIQPQIQPAALPANGPATAASGTVAAHVDPALHGAAQQPTLANGAGALGNSMTSSSSRFMQTQAQVEAQMRATKEAEERMRQMRLGSQPQAQQQQQQQRQQSVQATHHPAGATSNGSTSGPSAALPTQQQHQQQQTSAGPLSGVHAPQNSATQATQARSIPGGAASMSQSMYIPPVAIRSPPPSPGIGSSAVRPVQQSHQRIVSSSSSSLSSGQPADGPIDPLSAGPLGNDGILPHQQQPQPKRSAQTQPLGGQQLYQPQEHGSTTTQSMFLPGRAANERPGPPGSRAPITAEERKRNDARKAASLLAGAF